MDIDRKKIDAFCSKWKIIELSLFGSVIRDDFRTDSDVDVLLSFEPSAKWSLFDLVDIQEDLESMFGRPVDIVEKDALRNPFRRASILQDRKIVYAA